MLKIEIKKNLINLIINKLTTKSNGKHIRYQKRIMYKVQ